MANNDNNSYWYGIQGITLIDHGEWSDPEIKWNGVRINSHIVEDAMCWRYSGDIEDGALPPDDEYGERFERYMKEHADDVYELFAMAVESGAGDYESFEAADFVNGEYLSGSRYWFQGPDMYGEGSYWLTPDIKHDGKRTWLVEEDSGFEMDITDFSKKPEEIYKAFEKAYKEWALS